MRSSTALMAAAALLLLLVSVAAADTSIIPRSEGETRRVFVEWKAKHGKTYHSVGEEERRYAVFKDNLRLVEQHNAEADAGLSSYHLGLNHFADLTDEDFGACYKSERETTLSTRYHAADNEDLPDGGTREQRWPREPYAVI